MNMLLPFGAIFAVFGCSAGMYFWVERGGGALGESLRIYEHWLNRHVDFLFLKHSGAQIARAQLVGVLLCVSVFLLTRNAAALLLAAVIGFLAPTFLRKRHLTRVAGLERQLDAWLLMLANALKSTPSLGEAIESTAALMPRPFNQEVELLVKELRLGAPLDRALKQTATRIGSPVISGAIMVIAVARQTGGDLSATLERAAAALRENARLEGVLRTKTAEGRGQVLVLALVPFLLGFVIAWLDGSWFDPMLQTQYGRGILAGCGAIWLFAILWAQQIAGAEL